VRTRTLVGLVLVGFVVLCGAAAPAAACATCFGAADAGMTRGMNNAILLLLGVVGVVQGGFVALFYGFWKRARQGKEASAETHVIEGGG